MSTIFNPQMIIVNTHYTQHLWWKKMLEYRKKQKTKSKTKHKNEWKNGFYIQQDIFERTNRF